MYSRLMAYPKNALARRIYPLLVAGESFQLIEPGFHILHRELMNERRAKRTQEFADLYFRVSYRFWPPIGLDLGIHVLSKTS